MNQLTIARHAAPAYHPIQTALAILKHVRKRLAAWSAQRRAYAALLSLGEHELKDIGISRAQALFEAEKPFWRG